MSLRRCYHAHRETYNPPTRGTRPSPCAAPTTPAHAESPEHTPSRAAMQPRMPTPKPPEHSTPQHTAPPQESPMVTHCPAKHHAQAAKFGSRKHRRENGKTNIGSPQGDGISGIFFNIALENALRTLRVDLNEKKPSRKIKLTNRNNLR